jgi:hypothetical protein
VVDDAPPWRVAAAGDDRGPLLSSRSGRDIDPSPPFGAAFV